MGFPVLDIINLGSKIIDKLIPDPAAKAAAQLELLKLQQAGEFKELEASTQLSLAQVEVNKVEAASDSVFKSSWRPLCGYVCVSGLAYQFLLQPLLTWVSGMRGWMPPPVLDLGSLITMLGGMLGLGALRTQEKLKGVQ